MRNYSMQFAIELYEVIESKGLDPNSSDGEDAIVDALTNLVQMLDNSQSFGSTLLRRLTMHYEAEKE